MQESCFHNTIETIGRRSGVDYVRCLDCDQILEADDLEQEPFAAGEHLTAEEED